MTTKLKWRLSKLPTPSELVELVANKLITQEDAKEILFAQDETDTEALKSEIEFLRKVVDKLSESRTEKVRVIEKEIHHYKNYGWYQPYITYCSGNSLVATNSALTVSNGSGTMYLTGTAGTLTSANTGLSSAMTSSNLSSLKTF